MQNDCKLNSELLIEIDHLDNTLDAFEILINYDDFLQHLKLESEIYAPKNGRKFVISLDELQAFIGINFVMGYLKLTTLRSYWETGNPSVSINYVANVMTREKFKEILSNLNFSNNEEDLPGEHPDHDRAFKVRWLIDYLDEHFLLCMEAEAAESVDKHMVKYKDKSIMRQHMKNKPISRAQNVV